MSSYSRGEKAVPAVLPWACAGLVLVLLGIEKGVQEALVTAALGAGLFGFVLAGATLYSMPETTRQQLTERLVCIGKALHQRTRRASVKVGRMARAATPTAASPVGPQDWAEIDCFVWAVGKIH
jgi:hypothetical protein